MLDKFVIYTIAVGLSTWLVPGVKVDDTLTLVVTAAALGLINTIIRPLATLISLPFVILTGGLFLLVVNAAMIMIAGALIEGFHVEGFFPALMVAGMMFVVWLLTPSLAKKS